MNPGQRAHIEQLAREHRVELRFTGGRFDGTAAHNERWIELPAFDSGVLDSELYWVALHELGHIVAGRHPGFRPDFLSSMLGLPIPGKVENEARAWAWALDNARFPLDQAARTAIAGGLGSYLAVNATPLGDENLRRVVLAVGSDIDTAMYAAVPQADAAWTAWSRVVGEVTGQPAWYTPEPPARDWIPF